ncbi:hypothetical protein RU09_06030 [Microbacterium sp. MEJ108Y]|nr:hypothetical protein RU09_06030 [Microbacterium sp. MEJ108Y]
MFDSGFLHGGETVCPEAQRRLSVIAMRLHREPAGHDVESGESSRTPEGERGVLARDLQQIATAAGRTGFPDDFAVNGCDHANVPVVVGLRVEYPTTDRLLVEVESFRVPMHPGNCSRHAT